jgi:RHS repeat-associated protein
VISGSTYNLTYDAENRLTGVSGAATATFVYDGDGNRVKGTVGGVTITYIGNYYEWSGSTATSYYYAGSVRVAMRQGSTLSYMFADQLGSTSVVANSSGSKTAEVRYKAWGEDRYTSGTVSSGYRYTGQRVEATLGLYFYVARWYDASLGRFLSADTIVPSTGNPQAWDRYAYVDNNPVRYNDPSGHCAGPFIAICLLIIEATPTIIEAATYALTAYVVANQLSSQSQTINGEHINIGVIVPPGAVPLLPEDPEIFNPSSSPPTFEPIPNRPDLFRNGQPSDPNFGLKTPDKPYNNGQFDITPDSESNVGPGSGGLSTSSEPKPSWTYPWKYPSNAPDPEGIRIIQDQPEENPNHWLWEPAWDMPLKQFKQFLKDTKGNWMPPE